MMGRTVEPGSRLRLGLFRADFRPGALGDADDNWLSWVKPSAAKPDFHVPSAFAEWRVPRAGARPGGPVPDARRGARAGGLVLGGLAGPGRPRAGLTIGLHHGVSPAVVARFIHSEAGGEFLAACARLGLHVEYELHAMRELLPRSDFAGPARLVPHE